MSSVPELNGGPKERVWPERWASVLWLVGLVTALRLAYIAWGCPYTLIEDEAHYWEWSRHLDWSYYSKGPGVAWAIAASVRVFGDTEFAVRLPAVLAGAVGAIGVAGLARDATGRARAGFFAAACFILAPIYQFNAVLMTIDGPYLAAWALACWGVCRAMGLGGAARAGRGWLGAGAAVGIGFVFKYTILLLLPGAALFAWLDRANRRGARVGWWPWAGAAAALLGLLPVAIWNATNGWPTVRHLLGHLGMASGDIPAAARDPGGRRFDPSWMLEFIGLQLVIFGPLLYLGVVGLVSGLRGSDRQARRGMAFLLCCSAPIVLFYLAVSVVTEVEGNWASAGYVSLMAAAGWAAAGPVAGRPVLARRLWIASLVVGVLTAGLSLRLDWLARGLAWPERGLRSMGLKDERPLIPTGRLVGARELALDAEALAERLREQTGLEPFYVADHYGRASILAFYLPGHPTVYCSSSALDQGRRTQYDYWPETDLTDLRVLGGRPGVCLGKARSRWEEAFVRVEDAGRLAHEPKRDRLVFLGFDYRGFGFARAEGGADTATRSRSEP